MNDQRSLFDEVDVIYSYTRAQAIADGVLKDVTKKAREAGIRFPVAVTANLWHGYIIPRETSQMSCQSIEGRLWETLFLFHCASREQEWDTLFFEVSYIMRRSAQLKMKSKAVCDPGNTTVPASPSCFHGRTGKRKAREVNAESS